MGIFAYGVVAYLLSQLTFLYLAGFIVNLGVPTALDRPADGPIGTALLVDAALIAAFAVQHSVMARPAFKLWWTRVVPPAAERSTYLLASDLALVLLFWQWRPMGGVVWDVDAPAARAALYGLYATGWLVVLATTFVIDHFDLFGLRQVWLHLRGRAYTHPRLATPGPYRLVRHPLYVGWLMVFWATPTMTAAHLVFALGTTAYILVAIRFEERDLAAAHGRPYLEYRARTPMLVPRLGARTEPAPRPRATEVA